MRDTHRLKEKYELSLDNRQVVTLAVATLVVVSGVFVLGVMVGKKLAAQKGPEQGGGNDLLSQVEEKTRALDELQQVDAALTFQEELTKKKARVVEPPIPPSAPAPPAAPRPSPASAAPASEVAPPVASAVAAADVAEPTAEERPTEAPVLPEKPKAETVTTRTDDAGTLKEAFGKVQRSPDTGPARDWALQLAAYQSREEADRLVAGLRDKGHAPYVVEAELPGKGTWYRVRLGHFESKEVASRYLDDFKRETQLKAIVTK